MGKNSFITTEYPSWVILISSILLIGAHLMELFHDNRTIYRALFVAYYVLLVVIDYMSNGKVGLFRLMTFGTVILIMGMTIVGVG